MVFPEVPLPAFQDPARRAAILARSRVLAVAAGESLVLEGQQSTAFYVVIEGELEVSIASAHGPAKVLGVLGAGEWFGEEAVLRGQPRSATVRAIGDARCIEVPSDVLVDHVLADAPSRGTLVARAEVRLAERSLRSLAFFAELDPDEAIEGNVVRRPFAAGDVVFQRGEPATAMGFVLEGVVRVGDTSLGPGQCVGEQDILASRPLRSVAAIAETAGVLLAVRAERFAAWVACDRELADWVGTLQQIYRVADGRHLSVYEAIVDGHRCAVTVFGDPSTDGVVTTDRIGADHLVIARARAHAATAVVRWQDRATVRELHLANPEHNPRGDVTSGDLVRVVVEHTAPDVGQLYRRIADDSTRLVARDLARFRRTGHLGGAALASERALLCQCLQIDAADVPSCASVCEVQRATGAGVVCGGCVPAIEQLVVLRAREPAAAVPREAVAPSTVAVPQVRDHAFAFAAAPLRDVRGVPEVLLIAVTSLLSSPAERFLIATLGEAAPRLRDPSLAAAVHAFVQQESNHIVAHAPLNRMLVDEVYPYADRLRRLGDEMLARYRDRPLAERLAIGAAYEYASDCIFGAVYETHFAEGRRFHHEARVHDALLASGVGPLFSWHALEELGHRHVAFEVARALGVTRWQLRRGMLRVLADLARLQFPAIVQMLAREPTASVLGFVRAVLVDPGFVRSFGAGLRHFLRSDFDPGAQHYHFLDALARDVDAHQGAAC